MAIAQQIVFIAVAIIKLGGRGGVEKGRSPTVFRNHQDVMEITCMWSQTYWGYVTLHTLLDPLGLCFFYSGNNVHLTNILSRV